jgi:hypothetical protein
MQPSVKLPKSFVAIDLSEKEAFERRGNGTNGNGLKKDNVEPEAGERGRSEERTASANADVHRHWDREKPEESCIKWCLERAFQEGG